MAKSEKKVKVFASGGGAKIFHIPLNAFPGFWAYAYLVIFENYKVLIDTGSNWGKSNEDLEEGFKEISQHLEEEINFEDLTHIFITHGHIDHFGGLAFLRPLTKAKVGVHELDRRILSNYEERLKVAAQRLLDFLKESGISKEERKTIYDYYIFPKSLFSSVEIDFTYEAEGMQVGPFQFFHTPGHAPGLVVIRLHDVLFSGDHILSGISPHQAPERLTLNTGLNHYLDSLKAVKAWAPDVKLVLGGHKDPVTDLPGRVDEISTLHFERLNTILGFLDKPMTIAEISNNLFTEINGYNTLLAIEETGAHVEYLYQRGFLSINNLDQFKQESRPPVIEYCRAEKSSISIQEIGKEGVR